VNEPNLNHEHGNYFVILQIMKTTDAVTALAALAQDTRLAVYRLLVQQGPSGLAAGEIAGQLGIAPATLSFHLKELAHGGLVSSRQDGRFIFYAANFDAMNALVAFLTENCCAADCGPSCTPTVACNPVSVVRTPRKAKRSKA
jgi:ArsR family transcriptional regulator, arsenate/arsenite/antimonite-responsive transcriptional repressor